MPNKTTAEPWANVNYLPNHPRRKPRDPGLLRWSCGVMWTWHCMKIKPSFKIKVGDKKTIITMTTLAIMHLSRKQIYKSTFIIDHTFIAMSLKWSWCFPISSNVFLSWPKHATFLWTASCRTSVVFHLVPEMRWGLWWVLNQLWADLHANRRQSDVRAPQKWNQSILSPLWWLVTVLLRHCADSGWKS